MRRFLIFVMIAVVGFSAGAAQKKPAAKQPAKPAAPKPGAAEVLVGALSKDTAGGKTVYTLTTASGDKMEVPEGPAKRMSINLGDFVGKDVAVTAKLSDDKKTIKDILAVVTKADYKKH